MCVCVCVWFVYQLVNSPVDKFVSLADLVGCSLLRTIYICGGLL